MKANKVTHKFEDLFPRRWNGRRDRALFERIKHDASRSLRLEG